MINSYIIGFVLIALILILIGGIVAAQRATPPHGSRGATMFGSTRKAQAPAPAPMVSSKPETIIGANTSFIGTLKTDGNVRIDGRVEGDIEILGNLIIGETGQVIATIKAQNVHVSGAVKGEITAVEQLEISPTGKIWGDIITAALHIEPGGLFRGQSAMSTNIDEPLLLEAPRNGRAE